MSLPVHSSSTSGAFSATANPTIAPGTVAVGDVLTISICAQNNAVGTLTSVTDSLGNTYNVITTSPAATNRWSAIAYSVITAAGTPTVTVNLSGSRTGRLGAQIWTNVDSTPISSTFDSLYEPASTTSHVCSSAGVTPEADVAAICVGTCPNTGPTFSPGSGYAAVPTGGSGCFFQYQIAASFTNEQGLHTTNNSQRNTNLIVFLRGVRSATGTSYPQLESRHRGINRGIV